MPRRRGYGVYIAFADVLLFENLESSRARVTVVVVLLIISLVSMLFGVLLGDYLFMAKLSLTSERRALYRSIIMCLGVVATIGGVFYHYYGVNAGNNRFLVYADRVIHVRLILSCKN